MSADLEQALAAKCLTNPAFLSKAIECSRGNQVHDNYLPHPHLSHIEALSTHVFDGATLERLRLFSGLMTKVKHNPLREEIPKTFKLLSLLGLEISFFSFLSIPYVEMKATHGKLERDQQLDFFACHLIRFFESNQSVTTTAVTDVLRHELCLYRARMSRHAAIPHQQRRFGAVRRLGFFETHSYETDVVKLCSSIERHSDGLPVNYEPCILAYSKTGQTPLVTVSKIDQLARLVFSLVNDYSTSDEIGMALGGLGLAEIKGADLNDFFEEATSLGFLTID